MKRVCIVGDSHVAALLNAGVREKVADTRELTFFICHVDDIGALARQPGKLVATSAELAAKFEAHSGMTEIEFAHYDEFVVVGFDFDLAHIVNFHHSFVFDSIARAADPMGRYHLSDAAFLALCEATILSAEAMRIAAAIRRESERRVVLVAAPNPGVGLTEEEFIDGYPPFHAIVREGVDGVYASFFRQACANVAEKTGVAILPPLPEAAENGAFHRYEFSELTRTPADAGAELKMTAVVHASAAYGDLLIPHLFATAPTGSSRARRRRSTPINHAGPEDSRAHAQKVDVEGPP